MNGENKMQKQDEMKDQKQLTLEECVKLARLVPGKSWKKEIEESDEGQRPSITYSSRYENLDIEIHSDKNSIDIQFDIYLIRVISGDLDLGEYILHRGRKKDREYSLLERTYWQIARNYGKDPKMQLALAKAREILGENKMKENK